MNLRGDAPWALATRAIIEFKMIAYGNTSTTGEYINYYNKAYEACVTAFNDMTWQEQIEFGAKFHDFYDFVKRHFDEDQINIIRIVR